MTDTVFQKTFMKFIFYLFMAFKFNSALNGATTTTPPPPPKKKKHFSNEK